jgi:hypothetical protein
MFFLEVGQKRMNGFRRFFCVFIGKRKWVPLPLSLINPAYPFSAVLGIHRHVRVVFRPQDISDAEITQLIKAQQ